jgi:hypothetical protein
VLSIEKPQGDQVPVMPAAQAVAASSPTAST